MRVLKIRSGWGLLLEPGHDVSPQHLDWKLEREAAHMKTIYSFD